MTDQIRAAGDHLLDVLAAEKSVNYSRFYNDAPETEEALVRGVMRHLTAQAEKEGEGVEDWVQDDARNQGHLHLEWAAWQLVGRGVVTIEELEGTKLIDDEPDYRITLTDRGEEFLKKERPFKYHHLDSRFFAKGASEWLIVFLHEGGEGQTFTLRDVMDPAYGAGGTEVVDDCKNVYPPGSPVFRWAFEVSLWHHARSGHVEPAPENDDQRAAWGELVARPHLFPMWGVKDGPLWDVPFRLAEGADAGKFRHVGWIGGE